MGEKCCETAIGDGCDGSLHYRRIAAYVQNRTTRHTRHRLLVSPVSTLAELP